MSLREDVADLLGLDSGADDDAILKEVDRRPEQRDRDTISAAVRDGTIQASTQQFWMKSLARDRAGTQKALAAMRPTLVRASVNTTAPSATTPSTDSTEPRVTASDGRIERVEYGREPTAQEKLEQMHYQMTNGAEGKKAPDHYVYFQDANRPKIIENGDGTGYWAPQTIPCL